MNGLATVLFLPAKDVAPSEDQSIQLDLTVVPIDRVCLKLSASCRRKRHCPAS